MLTRQLGAVFCATLALYPQLVSPDDQTMQHLTEGVNCSFRVEPDAALNQSLRYRSSLDRSLKALASGGTTTPRSVAAASLPRRNFIDDAIFNRLEREGIPAAPLSSDAEFVRRIYLDLTGRIPTVEETEQFLSSSAANKRDELIERLLYSSGFTDRFTMWFGDLVENTRTSTLTSQNNDGRNAFHDWIRTNVSENKSLKDMVFHLLTSNGNNYDLTTHAATNWLVRGRVANGGPAQDTYDMLASRALTQFMGMSHYDCLMCHDGSGHLDQVSAWGTRMSRYEAWQMAAHFSRVRLTNNSATMPFYRGSFDISDATTGQYDLNTRFGNRPFRQPIGNLRNITPVWRDGVAAAAGETWRGAFAQRLIADPLFSINFANRLWKQLFNLGLVEPIDGLDPARLDPAKPPAAPWTLQASHPELLLRLADELRDRNFNLREFVKLIVTSTAWQLSSSYDGEWNIANTSTFARHLPRRLEGEELADSIAIATQRFSSYTVTGWGNERINLAVRAPEPREPGGDAAATALMDSFLRGNRDSELRRQDASILQQLNLMNNTYVTSRMKVSASPVLASAARLTDNDAAVQSLFIAFLSRWPQTQEREKAIAHLKKATTPAARNLAIEDLAWVLTNKVEFQFSY
jgi:hypothetical protein